MSKRKEIEKYIIDRIAMFDNREDGNIKLYKEFFASMNDTMFKRWFNDLKEGRTKLFFYMANFEHNITNHDLIKIAKKLNVTLFERIIREEGGRKTVSDHEYLILKLPVRRVAQTLDKKINLPLDDTKVSQMTGQVTGESKGSSMSLPQIRLNMSKGLKHTTDELINVRGGNTEAYALSKAMMLENGEYNLSEIDTQTKTKSVEVAGAILKAMHLDTNI